MTTNANYDNNDPYAVATSVAEAPDMRFGQANVEARFVGLIKGSGKVDFDATQHDKRYTEVVIRVDPLAETNRTFFDRREMLAEFGDFTKVVWPSLRELGCKSIRDLHGKWCVYEMAVSGQYTAKDGSKRDSTTFKFAELYSSEAECKAAYEKHLSERYSVSAPTSADDAAMAVDMTPGAGSKTTPINDTERETAKQFLAVLVKQYGANRAALATAIASMPMVSKYFTAESPEAQVV